MESFENTLPNEAVQIAQSATPANLFEERIRWESDRELKKMYVLEKSHVKNRMVSGSIFLGLSGTGLLTAVIARSHYDYSYYSTQQNIFTLGVMGAIGFGVGGAVTFVNLKKHQFRKKAIEQEFWRRNINPNSFTFNVQPSYDPLLHAPTITLRAKF